MADEKGNNQEGVLIRKVRRPGNSRNSLIGIFTDFAWLLCCFCLIYVIVEKSFGGVDAAPVISQRDSLYKCGSYGSCEPRKFQCFSVRRSCRQILGDPGREGSLTENGKIISEEFCRACADKFLGIFVTYFKQYAESIMRSEREL